MATQITSTTVRPSQCSVQSGTAMNLSKTLQVQDQIIEQLRADQSALREALESERVTLRECRLTSDRELKALQREKLQVYKVNKQQEVKIEELEKDLAYTKEALAYEQRNLRSLEKDHLSTVKELKLKMSKDFEKINKQEMLLDQLKSEVEDLKDALTSERNATNLLIREHNAEVKMLRQEVKSKSTEAYRELKERATREREEYREMQEEAEKTYRVLEKDFRDTLAAKDEELKRVKAEAKLIQKELEDQLRASLKEPNPVSAPPPLENNDVVEMSKFRRLKNEMAVLREQNRKLLNEIQSDASATNVKAKPAVPKKPEKLEKLSLERDTNRKTHVRDMIRKLQEKEASDCNVKPNFIRKCVKNSPEPEKEEMAQEETNQTLEDLKAIDEDIERLRKQIEERDKIISALREAAEAKDKKLDNLMLEYSKLQSTGKLDMETFPESNRATSSSPSSPPLCNGELCWTDSFVNKNYHEPVYAQLLNDHTALQKVYNDLRTKLESKESKECRKTEGGGKGEEGENAINLIMAEQIRALKEREAQLIWEAEELREQNDLMEFRILELEECRKEFLEKEMMSVGKHREEKIVWRERDIEEVSDSGVMSLPTSEDLTSDSELGEAIRNYSPLGPVASHGLSTPENSNSDSGIADLKLSKKSLKSSECLQESGIFVDSESQSSDCAIQTGTQSKSCQTESVLDKTLLDIIDSSCDLFLSKNPGYLEESKSDDLSTELSKLSVIQKRIQQKTKSPSTRSPQTVVSCCPHSNSLLFYEERLAQLEDKLKIYESSGDAKDALLAKRLQKELELAQRVKELTDKVTSLESCKKKLEEEKCEFEEAENDARFQCQRLEIRLQELIDKNTELELEVERHKVIMSEERKREKKKGSLEGLLSKYEQRNFELEEKELEAKQRLNMIEAAMPAIVAYNVYKMVQNPKFESVLPNKENGNRDSNVQITDPTVFQKLEEVMNDQKKLRIDYKKVSESAVDREKSLRKKIEELESKAAMDREKIEEMTNTLKTFKMTEKNEKSGSANSDELVEELKQMVANELQLRAQIERLEKNEQVYMHSLEKADEIWADMEADYKRRLKEAEEANSELQKRVSQLETTQAELEKTLSKHVQPEEKPEKIVKEEDLSSREEPTLSENEKLKMEISLNLDKKFEEHKKYLEMENSSLKEQLEKMEMESTKGNWNYHKLKEELDATKEELEREKELGKKLRMDLEEKSQSVTSLEVSLQGQISELTQELTQKSKELSSLEVTVAELREEVETLENKVTELVDTIQTSIKNQDEDSSSWDMSFQENVTPVSVQQNNPFRVGGEQQVIQIMDEIPAANEIHLKKENSLPDVEILIPKHFSSRFIVFAALSFPRQKIQFLFSYSRIQKGIVFTKECRKEVTEIIIKNNKEEEIFQLSLKNTELLQTLERMEEESKWKDREFEELQRIAKEIRREQESLQELYMAVSQKNITEKEEEEEEEEDGDDDDYNNEEIEINIKKQELKPEVKKSRKSREKIIIKESSEVSNVDFLQIINPIVAKTSEQLQTTISSLQIAFDNLQSKYRSKNFLSKPFFNQSRQKGDNEEIDHLDRNFSKEFSSERNIHSEKKRKVEGHPEECTLSKETEKVVAEVQTEDDLIEKTLFHNNQCKNSPEPNSLLSSFSSPLYNGSKVVEIDPKFTFAAPITILRKVGDDGIFLEWDVNKQPKNVTGFEIKVNGEFSHRVRSSSRNKALLRPLNLKEKISIHVFAISENGRSTKSSHVTFPNENFLFSSE